MREDRIRRYSTVFLVFLVVYAIYYPYRVVPGFLDFAFFEPNRMLSHRITDGYVTAQMRWMWFFMWGASILAGIYGSIAAVYSFNLCRIGRYFDPKFGVGLMHTGIGTSLSMIIDVFGNSARGPLLSWAHPDGQLPFALRYASSDLALILYGFGMFAIGLVIHEAAKISEENKAFV